MCYNYINNFTKGGISMEKENEIQQNEAEEKELICYEENSPRVARAKKIISLIVSVLLYCVCMALILVFCGADKEKLDDLYVTDEFKAVYANSTDIRTHVAGSEFSENGAIYAFSFIYNEQNNYMQLTVRYNERHLDEVVKAINKAETDIEYTLEDIEVFYKIVDANGNEYTPKVLDSAQWKQYVYFKLELTDVDFSTDSLSVHMMLKNIKQIETQDGKSLIYEAGSETNAGSVLTFHEKDATFIQYKYSRKEEEALK